MTLIELQLNEDSLATYFSHISLLNEWCEESFLEINVGKTKELVLDARKTKILFVPLKVNDEPVKVVSNFRYLDTLIDNKLCFSDNSDLIYKKSKKSQQRLYLLRKLRSFDVSPELLQIVYKSLVESVLTFNIVVWCGNLGVKRKAKLARIVGMAGKTTGAKQDFPSDRSLYIDRSWTENYTDLRRRKFQKLRSGWRYKVPIARKNVYKKNTFFKIILTKNPKCYFCFKFSGYLICWPCGFQGSALLTLW